MKTRNLLLTVVMCCVAATLAFADAFTGTWKLNEAKSKSNPAAAKNSTVVYENVGDQVKITIDGTTADGKPMHNEWTGKYDGKDYPVTGTAADDTRAFKKVNDHTLSLVSKKAGKTLLTGRIVVAPDGKTRTVTVEGTDAKGKKMSGTAVYDKQ